MRTVRQRSAIVEEHVAGGRQGGLLTKIKRGYLAVRHANDHEAPATDVASLWIHDGQRKVNCHGCVNGVATTSEHLRANLARHAIRGGQHATCAMGRNGAPARKGPPLRCDAWDLSITDDVTDAALRTT